MFGVRSSFWLLTSDLRPQVLSPWSTVPGPWSLVPGLWSLVFGPRSTVHGLWSLVLSPWSLVFGRLHPFLSRISRISRLNSSLARQPMFDVRRWKYDVCPISAFYFLLSAFEFALSAFVLPSRSP